MVRVPEKISLERYEGSLSQLMKTLLESMIGFVGLRPILDKIVIEHGNEEFGVSRKKGKERREKRER
jgi:hypothetical protein